MKVLVVDDDPGALDLLENALSVRGYEVHRAADGAEGLEVLRRESIRLVISDWIMPRMTGLELSRAVRSEGFGHYIYVILLTSMEGTEATVEGLRAGADDFMHKPFSPAELEVRLRAGERVLSLESRHMTIFVLARLAESRDPETGAHLERVRNYCRTLARRLAEMPRDADQIDEPFVQLLYETSPLHDIGKVAVPDCVLLKPGRLSEREFDMIKTHTVEGARTLDAALAMYPDARFLQVARDIARSHHERWDGAGYPDGLAGEGIPLAARIVALADAYDALVSKRIYKGAFSHDIARSIIVQDSGSHFDPVVVEAFLATEDEFRATHDRYSEPAASVA